MEGTSPDAPRRRWAIRIAVGLVFSGLLVAALLTQVDLARVGATLGDASPALLGLGLALYVVLGALRAWRFRVLVPGARFSSLFAINLIHLLLLRVMPMRTGELGFAWLMKKSGDAGFTQSLVGLLLLRVLDLTTVLVCYAVSVAALRAPGDPRSAGLVALVALAGVLAALFVRPVLRLAHRIAEALAARLGLDRFARVERVRRVIGDAVAWSLGLSRAALSYATALTVVQWIVSFVFVYVLALAMRLDVSLPQAVLGGVGTIVSTMLPIPGIGTFGTLEAGWAAGFGLAGVGREEAIATAFGYSAISFGYALVTSVPCWLWLSWRRQSTS